MEPTPPDDKYWFKFLFSIFVFLNVLDLMLTRMVLTLPGTREVNPLMASMFADGFWWAFWLKAALILLVGLISWLLWTLGLIKKILGLSVALMVALVLYQIYASAAHLKYLSNLDL